MSENKGRLYLYVAILVSVAIASMSFYTIYLINKSGMNENEGVESTLDIYQIKLEQDLGVGGDNYEHRELYTNEQFESDKRDLII